jgi:hypothetical protein
MDEEKSTIQQNNPGGDNQVTPQNSADEHPMSDVIKQLEAERNKVKMPTADELERERKRQKRDQVIAALGDGISAISNLWATSQYAPNMYNKESSMSDKVKARYDRIKKERDADAERFLNYSLKIGQLKQQDMNWRHQLEREKKEEDRYNKTQEHQAQREAKQDEQWQKTFDRQGQYHDDEVARWEKQFEEGKRQFNVSSSQAATRISMESKRLGKEMASGSMTFSLGVGKGNVSVPVASLNASNVSLIFSKLPENVRKEVMGKPIKMKDDLGQEQILGYDPPSTEAMLIAIGANIDKSEDAQKALKSVAGMKVEDNSNKGGGTMPGVGGSAGGGTMPGVK